MITILMMMIFKVGSEFPIVINLGGGGGRSKLDLPAAESTGLHLRKMLTSGDTFSNQILNFKSVINITLPQVEMCKVSLFLMIGSAPMVGLH